MSNTSSPDEAMTIAGGFKDVPGYPGWEWQRAIPTPTDDETWDSLSEVERLLVEVIVLRGEVAALRAQLMNRTTDRDETVYNVGEADART